MKTGTAFREIMIKEDIRKYHDDIKALLNADYIYRTNHGFEIDVLSLVDTLTPKNRGYLMKYLMSKSVVMEK